MKYQILKRFFSVSLIAAISFTSSAFNLVSMTADAAESESTLSTETKAYYDHWKEKYLVQNPYVTEEKQYYVFYGEQTYSEAGYAVEVTVSEAHGYGMLIAAAMADYDSQAKGIFDGMYSYYRAHLSEIGPNLMAWQQQDNGSAIVNVSGADSATDGDMDIAYSLLMADSIWGSDGEINYKQAAVDIINDIMEYEVNKTDWILQLGDWAHWSVEGDQDYAATRASDFMVQYMPAFAEAANDDRWLNVYNSTYDIISSITDEYGTGILPDFIVKDNSTGKFIPAPANYLESENDGNYYYNSCRTPWRISMDYLINGNEDAKKFADTITDFIINKTGGDPWEIMAGYTPDGQVISDWNDLCFVSPFMIAAACGDNAEWHDDVREMCLTYGEDVYFGETITMLCLIVDDGAWIVPANKNEPKPETIKGDVNSDGQFSIADVVLMQKWLLAVPDAKLADWKAGDLCEDDRLDVFDLCLMKRELLNNAIEKTIYVSTAEELRDALENAEAGDTILLSGGEYEWEQKGTAGSLFMSSAEGTANSPITIKSADQSNPAVIRGKDFSDGIAFYITGDYWNIEDITFCDARKGIILDNSNYTTIKNVTVCNTGEEGIHIRDGSSNCRIIRANVHNCGLLTPKYGEGIYIGSAKSTSGYSYDCNNNILQDCIIGPNTTAECVDIKEYTTGNIIENCTMYGGGMSETDSFIDVKGNETIVRGNTFYDDENANITDAVQVHCQVDGWGIDNEIYNNIAYLTAETAYFLRSWSGTSCSVWNNTRNPESDTYLYRAYSGSTITIIDETTAA